MNDKLKIELISAANTFLTAAIPAVAAAVSGGITWTLAFWGSVGLVALRVGIKAVIMSFVPAKLGGRK